MALVLLSKRTSHMSSQKREVVWIRPYYKNNTLNCLSSAFCKVIFSQDYTFG
jgi:hypothetical protein